MGYSLEVIEWMDAWCEDTEQDLSKIKCQPTPVFTVGWVVKENESGVLLAPELFPEEPGTTRYPSFIPAGMIVSRMKL